MPKIIAFDVTITFDEIFKWYKWYVNETWQAYVIL